MKTFIAFSLAPLFFLGCSSGEPAQEMAGDPAGAYDDLAGPESTALDPVSDTKVVTDAAWKTTWQGKWYFFQSEDNLTAFKTNPTAYVTEDGRIKPSRDPVTGADVRRNTEWKLLYKGAWYYFESDENLKKFQANPAMYIR